MCNNCPNRNNCRCNCCRCNCCRRNCNNMNGFGNCFGGCSGGGFNFIWIILLFFGFVF